MNRVTGLVYIAALAPDADETSQSQQAKFPVTDVFKYVEVADGAPGCGRKASRASLETSRKKSKRLFGPAIMRQLPGRRRYPCRRKSR
jgi:hypothetical protein